MGDRRIVVVLDCADPERLAPFWTAALDYERSSSEEPYVVLVPKAPEGPELILQRVPEPKITKNRMHLDVRVADLDSQVARLQSLGATRLGADLVEEAGFAWMVLADPEGNEFCVCVEPGD